MNDQHGRKPPALLLHVPRAIFSLVTTEGRRFIKEQALWNLLLVAVLAGIGEVLSYHWFLASFVAAAIMTGVFAVVLPSALQVGFLAGLSLMGIAFVRPVIMSALGIGNWARDTSALTHSRVVGRCGITYPGAAEEVLLVGRITALVDCVPSPALESALGAMGRHTPSEKGP
jgi:membrane protein implicated in regulation of membrane protease activity